MTSFPFPLRQSARFACLLIALPLAAQTAAPSTKAGPPPRPADAKALGIASRADYQDDPKLFDKLDFEVAAVGGDAALLLDLEQKLTDLLNATTTTAAAQQAIAERLSRVIASDPSSRSPALRLLGPWLSDPARQELARLALESVPGENVDSTYLRALRRAEGPARLALVQSVGVRRIAKAAPTLGRLLRDADQALADAAAASLGAIATPRAFGILKEHQTPITPAVLSARLDAAARQPTKAASATYRELASDRSAPDAIRQRAFRSLLTVSPKEATDLILEALRGTEVARRQVALETIADLTDPNAVAALTGALPALEASTQAAVIAAVGRRGDAAAVPAMITASTATAPEPRVAAIEALGALPGGPESVRRLTDLSVAGGSDAKVATESLSILRGNGVNEAIAAGARTGEPARRAVLVRQLGLRGTFSELAFLLGLHADPALPVRLAALEALDILATNEHERALITWATTATDSSERTRAVRTFLAAALRAPDTLERTRLLVSELDRGDRATQLLFLPALPRLPNPETVAVSSRLARSANAEVAEAALAALSRWPNSTAGAALVSLAEERPAVQARASDAATRLFERDTEAPGLERIDSLTRLLRLSPDTALLRRQLLLLSRAAEARALTAVESLKANPDVASEIEDTLLAIRSNMTGAPALTASDRVDHLGRMLDGQLQTAWSVRSDRESWLQIDFHSVRPIRRLTLDRGNLRNDFPERYEVFVTDNPIDPGAPRVAGEGSRDQSSIDLPAGVRGRYVIIRSRGSREDGKWSVAELRVD